MSKIFLIDLESVESRYTGQWKDHIPRLLQGAGHEVHVISGPGDSPSATTPGAFLNFGGTNIYKADQVAQLGRLFCSGAVQAGDHFILVGRVEKASFEPRRDPLLYFRGKYRRLHFT